MMVPPTFWNDEEDFKCQFQTNPSCRRRPYRLEADGLRRDIQRKTGVSSKGLRGMMIGEQEPKRP
jgi:hypothetical protein